MSTERYELNKQLAQIGLSFHPELDADNRIHEKFMELMRD